MPRRSRCGQGGLERVHRAAEDDREHPVPLRSRDVGDVDALLVVPRRRDHKVQPAEAVRRGVDRRTDAAGIGHVQAHGQVGIGIVQVEAGRPPPGGP